MHQEDGRDDIHRDGRRYSMEVPVRAQPAQHDALRNETSSATEMVGNATAERDQIFKCFIRRGDRYIPKDSINNVDLVLLLVCLYCHPYPHHQSPRSHITIPIPMPISIPTPFTTPIPHSLSSFYQPVMHNPRTPMRSHLRHGHWSSKNVRCRLPYPSIALRT